MHGGPSTFKSIYKKPALNMKFQAYNSSTSVEIKIGNYGGSVFSKNDAKAGFQKDAS